jgi:hypothetical protein
MRTHTITTYSFDELSPEAQRRAIDKLWDINVASYWWDYIYDDAANVGIKINPDCKGEFTRSATYTANKILQEHGEVCETYQTANGFLDELNRFLETAETDEYGELYLSDERQVEEMELEFLRSILDDYRILLQKEYDYQTSDEAIIETIQANEYEFTENGELYILERGRVDS